MQLAQKHSEKNRLKGGEKNKMAYTIRAKTKTDVAHYGKFKTKKSAEEKAFRFREKVIGALAQNPKLKKQVGKFKISVVKGDNFVRVRK